MISSYFNKTLSRSLIPQAQVLSATYTPSANFSQFFRDRDFKELNDYEQSFLVDWRYLLVSNQWKNGLERKRLRRERMAQIKANETLPGPEPEKFVVHNYLKGIELPVPEKGIFAVIKHNGNQYKVTQDDVLVSEWLKDVDINDQIVFDNVLMVGTKDFTSLGRPSVEGARVYATVEEQTLSQKEMVFKKKRRKNYKKTQSMRQHLTILRIDKVEFDVTDDKLKTAVRL